MVEKDVENEIIAWAEGLGGMAYKLVLRGRRGWPDLSLHLPGGVLIYVEVKRPRGGKIYAQQSACLRELEDLGFCCVLSRSLDEVRKCYAQL